MRTQCGCLGVSSRASSTTTIRSVAGTSASSAASSVVLPVPVPPEIRNGTLRAITLRHSSRASSVSDPAM